MCTCVCNISIYLSIYLDCDASRHPRKGRHGSFSHHDDESDVDDWSHQITYARKHARKRAAAVYDRRRPIGGAARARAPAGPTRKLSRRLGRKPPPKRGSGSLTHGTRYCLHARTHALARLGSVSVCSASRGRRRPSAWRRWRRRPRRPA